jgi:hypothetical protein
MPFFLTAFVCCNEPFTAFTTAEVQRIARVDVPDALAVNGGAMALPGLSCRRVPYGVMPTRPCILNIWLSDSNGGM